MATPHIRRSENQMAPEMINAFRAALTSVQKVPNSAIRVVFRKLDGTIRTMDVAYDEKINEAFTGKCANATATRAATNQLRGNLPVRERIYDNSGNILFQWRTIPLSRILSISPCI